MVRRFNFIRKEILFLIISVTLFSLGLGILFFSQTSDFSLSNTLGGSSITGAVVGEDSMAAGGDEDDVDLGSENSSSDSGSDSEEESSEGDLGASAVDDEGVSAAGEFVVCGEPISGGGDTEYYLVSNLNCVSTLGVGIEILKSDIVFDCRGYSILGPGNNLSSNQGIHVKAQKNVTIQNCNVSDTYSGIYLNASNDSSVINSSFYSIYEGVYILDSNDIGVDAGGKSSFGDGNGTGISIFNSGNVSISNHGNISSFSNGILGEDIGLNVTVENNTVYNNSVGFKFISNNSDVNILDNVVLENNNGFLLDDLNSSEIFSNQVINNSKGLTEVNGFDLLIKNNNFSLQQNWGVNLSFTDEVELNNNSFFENGEGGLLLSEGSNNTFLLDNTFSENIGNLSIEDLEEGGEVIITYNNSFGNLNWTLLNASVLSEALRIGETIFLENNRIGVANGSGFVNLDVSSNVSFYSLAYASRSNFHVYKDGEKCDSNGLCNVTNYDSSSGELNLHVEGYSSYSTSVNTAPVFISQDFNATSEFNFTFDDLNCSASAEDNESISLTVYWELYRDDVLQNSGSLIKTNNTFSQIVKVDSTRTLVGQEWKCGVMVSDGLFNSSWQNSSSIKVESCGELTEDIYFTEDVQVLNSSNDFCYNSSVSGLTLDLAGYTLSGNNSFEAFNFLDANNITIINGSIYNFSKGVVALNVSELNLSSLNFSENDVAIDFTNVSNSSIFNSEFQADNFSLIFELSENNTIANNIFNSTVNNVLANGSNYWNSSYDCDTTSIIGKECSGGNYWNTYPGLDDGSGSYPNNESGDGIGDTDLPWNNSGEINSSYGSDFLPLVICSESWSCGSWSSCSGGTQSRSCTDVNSCGTEFSKPSESQSCSSGGGRGSSGWGSSTGSESDEATSEEVSDEEVSDEDVGDEEASEEAVSDEDGEGEVSDEAEALEDMFDLPRSGDVDDIEKYKKAKERKDEQFNGPKLPVPRDGVYWDVEKIKEKFKYAKKARKKGGYSPYKSRLPAGIKDQMGVESFDEIEAESVEGEEISEEGTGEFFDAGEVEEVSHGESIGASSGGGKGSSYYDEKTEAGIDLGEIDLSGANDARLLMDQTVESFTVELANEGDEIMQLKATVESEVEDASLIITSKQFSVIETGLFNSEVMAYSGFLKPSVANSEIIEINPGEEIEFDVDILGAFSTKKAIPVTFSLEAYNGVVYSEEIVIEQDLKTKAIVAPDDIEKSLDIFVQIINEGDVMAESVDGEAVEGGSVDSDEGEKEEYYLEVRLVELQKKLEMTTFDEFISNVPLLNKMFQKTVFVEFYGPYLLEEEENFVFMQKYLYDPTIYDNENYAVEVMVLEGTEKTYAEEFQVILK